MMIIALILQLAWSAPHNSKPDYPDHVSYSQIRRMVQLEGKEDLIKKLGPEAYKHMRDLMLSSNESVEDRWKATLALAKVGGPLSVPDLEIVLKNSQWFMRAAGILGIGIADRAIGIQKAKEFMRADPALLVRATALQVLAQQQNLDKDFLWSEIQNPMNFNNGKSLPIRVSILKVLEKSLDHGDTDRLMALSREDNKEIQSIARDSLTRIATLKKSGATKKVSSL